MKGTIVGIRGEVVCGRGAMVLKDAKGFKRTVGEAQREGAIVG